MSLIQLSNWKHTWEETPTLNPLLMAQLQTTLHETHPYAPLYKQAHRVMLEKPPEEQTRVIGKVLTGGATTCLLLKKLQQFFQGMVLRSGAITGT